MGRIVQGQRRITQGQIWWADLPEPIGSAPGYPRPVVVVQGNLLNRSRIATVVCVPLTGNLRWATAPGNILLSADSTGLPRDSVATGSQIVTLDREQLTQIVGAVSPNQLQQILDGIEVVLGRR